MTIRRWILVGAAAVAVAAAVFFGWRELHRSAYPDRIASSNGRLEAEQVDITSKLPGRIVQVLARKARWSMQVPSWFASTPPRSKLSFTPVRLKCAVPSRPSRRPSTR